MTIKQLTALFLCYLTPYYVGNALLALLPVYAIQLGADEAITGIYLGLAFATLAVGTLLSGWLSDRFQRRKETMLGAALIALPAGWLMGRVDSVFLLTVFTMVVWFAGGLSSGTVNILTGIYAEPANRGRVFGIIGAAGGLAQILGGLTAGPIVEHWGYVTLFSVAGSVWIIQAVATTFLEDKKIVHEPDSDTPSQVSTSPMSMALWLLILASMMVGIANFSTGLARPLMMDMLKFDASAISSAVAVGGLVSLPAPFLLGWLSDKVGRKKLLIMTYVMASIGTLIMLEAVELWVFWVSIGCFSLNSSAMSIGSALITDMVQPRVLSKALTRYASSLWVAGTLGYGITGIIIQSIGMQGTLFLVAMLPLTSVLLIIAIRSGSKGPVIRPAEIAAMP